MIQEHITAIYYNKITSRMWVMYTIQYPEYIDGLSESSYITIKDKLEGTKTTKTELYSLINNTLSIKAKLRMLN